MNKGLLGYPPTVGPLSTWPIGPVVPVSPMTFAATGAAQTFVVPAGITGLVVDVQGAQGGPNSAATVVGGQGARVQSVLSVTPGQVLQVNVGRSGSVNGPAGFGGGGSSQFGTTGVGGSGGGASDIRTGAYALADRVVVAGGGGGAGGNSGPGESAGGTGGAPTGGAGGAGGGSWPGGSGGGATTSAGGSGGANSSDAGGGTAGSGALGTGGAGGALNLRTGGGGGGGLYGGGGGGTASTGGSGGGGGGGSSAGTGTLTSGFRSGDGLITLTWPFLISDSFTRADSTTSLGTADTGQVWSVNAGTWGISSNRAYLNTVTGQASAVLETRAKDAACQVTVITGTVSNRIDTGMVFRCADDNNYMLVGLTSDTTPTNNVTLYKRVSGTFTPLVTVLTGTIAANTTYILRAEYSGTTVKVYVNGTLQITYNTSTGLESNTKCGIRESAGTGSDNNQSRFDDFSVYMP